MQIKYWLNLTVFALALALTGGAQANQVTISWADSPSAQVTRYRIYSSVASGNYRIGTGFILEPPAGVNSASVDVPFPVGTNLYMVVTALDSAGLESAPSNEVVKAVTDAGTPPTNFPPILVPIGNKSILAGQELFFTLSANDPNGDAVTYTATGLPEGAELNAITGAFGWTPGLTQTGSHQTTFFASDAKASNSETVVITITSSTNHQPSLASVGGKTGTVNQLLFFTLLGNDPDGDTLTYSSDSLPAGASLDAATGQFQWTPSALQLGEHSIVFTVSDAEASDSKIGTITVGQAPNQPPVLTDLADCVVTAGHPLGFTLSANDGDNDTLIFSADSLPTGATLNGATGGFTWTPSPSQVGSYTMTFSVYDGSSGDSRTCTVTVEAPANQLPTIEPLGPLAAPPETLLAFTLSATDPDGGTLTFSCGNLPQGATLDANSGEFAWTPALGQVGVYLLDFVVSDGAGIGTASVQISVDEMTATLEDSTSPVDVVSGDITGDGATDLIVLDSETSEVLVYEGNGKGKFKLHSKNTITGRPITGKAKKPDATSTSEIIVLTEGASVIGLERSVEEVALNSTGIHLVSAKVPGVNPSNEASFPPTALDVADLDGDGLLDAVVTRLGTNDVAVLFRSADNVFTEAYSLQTGLAPIAVILTDFDLDGFQDMAVSNSQGYGVSIYLGSPTGDFTYIEEIITGSSPGHLTSGDFDLDGIPDLAIPDSTDGTIAICLGNGDGTFLTLHYLAVTYAPFVIEAGDLNADGVLDLAVLSRDDNYVHLLYGQGDGYFAEQGRLRAGETPVSLLLDDLDGDGIPEVAVCDPGLQRVTLMRPSQAEPPETSTTRTTTAPSRSEDGGSCFLDTLLK